MVAKDFQGMAILPRPPAKMGFSFTKAHHRHTAHGHHGDGHPEKSQRRFFTCRRPEMDDTN